MSVTSPQSNLPTKSIQNVMKGFAAGKRSRGERASKVHGRIKTDVNNNRYARDDDVS